MDYQNEELEQYRLQLSQVEALLAHNPDNADLQKLAKDLADLIAISEDLVREHEDKVAASAEAAGANGESAASEASGLAEGKDAAAAAGRSKKSFAGSSSATSSASSSGAGAAKKFNPRAARIASAIKQAEEDQNRKKNAWLDFNKKGAAPAARKKGDSFGMVSKPPLAKKSIFAVPEGGKVGVIGSGRPMTQFQKKEKVAPGASAAPTESSSRADEDDD